jgi:hypothetical protein
MKLYTYNPIKETEEKIRNNTKNTSRKEEKIKNKKKKKAKRKNRSGPVSQLKRPHHHNQYVLILFKACTQQRLPTDTSQTQHIYSLPLAQLPMPFLSRKNKTKITIKQKGNESKNSGGKK